jgi:hypothetical protein
MPFNFRFLLNQPRSFPHDVHTPPSIEPFLGPNTEINMVWGGQIVNYILTAYRAL